MEDEERYIKAFSISPRSPSPVFENLGVKVDDGKLSYWGELSSCVVMPDSE